MRFEVDFSNPETGESRVIAVQLNAEETNSLSRMTERRDLIASAYATLHGYRQAPEGFQHVKDGIRALPI